MKILDSALVKDHYDVVVVGAGNGGLTTAALLAKRGVKVLVVEQNYIPGGCVSAIRRHDVAMDVGAAILFGWGEGGMNPHRFVMNELEEEIDMIPHESIMRIHMLGKKVNFWRDMNKFLDELVAIFPHQDKEIRDLYADFKEFYDSMMVTSAGMMSSPTDISPLDGMKVFFKNPAACVKMGQYLLKTEEDVIGKYISDPKLMSFFDVVTMFYTTCNVTESPALLGATMFIDNHVGGACYPAGSPQMLPNKLEKSIERNGGQIIYRQLVDEILIFKGKAYGIRLNDGTEIMADRVVSNADIYSLYGTLVRPRNIKPKRMKWAQEQEKTVNPAMLYIVVKAEAIPEDTKPIEVFVEGNNDVDSTMGVFVPALDDPTVAPPGKHSITVIAPNKLKWPALDDRFYQSEEYYKMKAEFADTVIDKLEQYHFPNLRENIISMDVGSPTSTERFTRKVGGHIGGPKISMKQNFFVRMKNKSEWENLYCAGDSTTMGEGVVSTCMSGVGAANAILKDMGLPLFQDREHTKQYVNMIKGRPWTETPDPSEPITEASAMRMARDCSHCETPECRSACPADIDTCYFARRIESGNFIGAARVLREVNPFSESCGYICPAERYCEKDCNRLEFDNKPVRIRDLHGWVCGHVSPFEGWDRSFPPKNGRKVAVVGAGPAGLTCAHYLARLGYQIDIMDKADKPGGMLQSTIPAFRMPEAVVNREIDGMTISGMSFQYGKELGKDFTIDDLDKEYEAVFLAPGLGAGRNLKMPGMEKTKTTDAMSFLNAFRAKGKVKVAKNVLIIGGGSVASDAAMVAKASGAENVTLVCLETETEMPCLNSELEEMKEKGIRIENGWGPKEVLSKSKMSFVSCTAVFDDKGQFSPSFDETKTMEFTFGEVIVAIGQTMEPALAKNLKKTFGKEGLLEIDEKTNQVVGRPGIYAGGDIARGAGTVVEAVGDGRRAARAIAAASQ